VRSLRRGQITIPAEFREKLGLGEDALLSITLRGKTLEIAPVRVAAGPGSPWLKELYELFAPVREDLSQYSEEEIDRAIERSVAEVRAKRGR
jgi:AbrB family looped-hinge helix DNA binding protein